MHYKNLSGLLGAVLAVAAACTALAADQSPSRVANGKRLFLTDGCFECHGSAGEGGVFNDTAPVLAGILKRESIIEVFATVRKGPNDMPAYTQRVLPDQDLYDIIAYLRSLPGPGDPKDYPALNK
jgi:mono/diheme cytochrome c family protein